MLLSRRNSKCRDERAEDAVYVGTLYINCFTIFLGLDRRIDLKEGIVRLLWECRIWVLETSIWEGYLVLRRL